MNPILQSVIKYLCFDLTLLSRIPIVSTYLTRERHLYEVIAYTFNDPVTQILKSFYYVRGKKFSVKD